MSNRDPMSPHQEPGQLEPTKQDVFRLLRDLAALTLEFQRSAKLFKDQGNDEGYCCISAASDRLYEVVNEWIANTRKRP